MARKPERPGLPVFLTLAGAIILAIPVIFVQKFQPAVQEGGPVETLSAALLFASGLLVLIPCHRLKALYLPLTCFLLSERELDARSYHETNPLHAFLNGLDVTLDMTAVRAVLLALLLWGVMSHGLPALRRIWVRDRGFLRLMVVTGVIVFVSQIPEELSGALQPGLSDITVARFLVVEEILELFFAVGILGLVLLGWRRAKALTV